MKELSRQRVLSGVVATQQPSARELWTLVAGWRHERRRGRSAGDVYVAVFAVLVLGSMAWSALRTVGLPLVHCASAPCERALALTAASGAVVVPALVAVIASLWGPLAVSPGAAWWVVSGPVDRAGILRPVLLRTIAAALIGGAAGSGLLWLLIGDTAWWLLPGALASSAAVGALCARQSESPALTGRSLAATAVTWLAVVAAAERFAPGVAPWVSAVGALVAAVFMVFAARRSLSGVTRAALADAGGRRQELTAAGVAVDAQWLADAAVRPLLATRYRRLRLHGTGWRTLAMVDVARLTRRSPRVLWCTVPLLIGLGWVTIAPDPSLAPVPAMLLALVLTPLLTSVRTLGRAAGLRRGLPLSRRAAVLASSAGALTITAVWLGLMLLVALLLPGAGWWHIAPAVTASAIAGYLGAVRWATGSAPEFGTGYVMTDAGPVPVSAMFSLAHGLDALLILTLPPAFGLPATAVLGWTVIGAVFVIRGLR